MKRKSSSGRKSAQQSARTRPTLPPVSDEMKAWSTALASELSEWPQVTARSFFGFTALYRKDTMFAALPRTRSLGSANSLAFKIQNPVPAIRKRLEGDPRIGAMGKQKARWFTFEISSGSDLHDALDWLGRAFEAASKAKGKAKKSR